MFTSQYDRNMIYAMHCACCAACATTGGPPAINIKLFNTQYAEELTMQKPLYFTMKIFQQYWSRECLNISGCYRKINKNCIIWIINRLSSHIYIIQVCIICMCYNSIVLNSGTKNPSLKTVGVRVGSSSLLEKSITPHHKNRSISMSRIPYTLYTDYTHKNIMICTSYVLLFIRAFTNDVNITGGMLVIRSIL